MMTFIIPDTTLIGQTVDATTGESQHVQVLLLNCDWIKVESGMLYRICSAVSENGLRMIYALENR